MWSGLSVFSHVRKCYESERVYSLNVRSSILKKSSETFFYTWNMKANRHDYDNIFSVCVLYAAHGIFITIKDVYDYKQCGIF